MGIGIRTEVTVNVACDHPSCNETEYMKSYNEDVAVAKLRDFMDWYIPRKYKEIREIKVFCPQHNTKANRG